MDEFTGIDLQDTFILDWQLTGSVLEFNLEASIWPSSQFYSAPKPNEHTCYKFAKLQFVEFENIEGLLSLETAKYTVDPDGSKDYGHFDSLEKTAAGFLLAGDFGTVSIKKGSMKFEIKP